MYTKYDYGNDSSLTTNSDFNTHLEELNSNTYQDYYLPLEVDRLALHGGIISNPIGTSTDNSKRNKNSKVVSVETGKGAVATLISTKTNYHLNLTLKVSESYSL